MCWYRYVSLCLQGWVIAHFRHVVPRSRYQDYEWENPHVGKWRPQRGFKHVDHFGGLLDSMEHCHITWSRTSTDETWSLFRTCAGTPDGSWLGNKRWCVTCPSRFWGSTNMFKPFPDLLLWFCLLPQQMWLLSSWNLLCTSLASRRGVTRSRTTSLGSIQIGTLGGSTVYHILSSSTLLQSLTLSCRDLSTRIFLLTRTGPDVLLIHYRSLAAWETEWSMRWRFQRWFRIHSSSAFWRAFRPSIAVWPSTGSTEKV